MENEKGGFGGLGFGVADGFRTIKATGSVLDMLLHMPRAFFRAIISTLYCKGRHTMENPVFKYTEKTLFGGSGGGFLWPCHFLASAV